MTFEELERYRQIYINWRQSWFRQIRRQHHLRFVIMDFHIDEDWTTIIHQSDRAKHRRDAMRERTERWLNLRRYCAKKF